MRLFKITAFTSLMLFSLQSQAALVQTDWKVAGDGLATLDTVSGLEWLDLTVTDSYSIALALSKMGVGQLLEGWRLPTHKEVVAMLARQFPSQNYRENESVASRIAYGAEAPEATQYRTLFGTTYSNDTWADGGWTGGTHGMYVNDNPDASNLPAVVSANVHRSNTGQSYFNLYSINSGTLLHMTYSHANNGVFLVSDGGVTRSSLLDPTLNINNPSAPINQVAAVPVNALGMGLLGVSLLLGARRVKA